MTEKINKLADFEEEIYDENEVDEVSENKIKLGTILEIIASICAIIGIGTLIYLNMSELNDQKRAENTLNNLREIRIAMEKYYNKANTYPELSKSGAWNNLRILDYYNANGELISFAEIYGSDVLKGTFKNDALDENNTVRDTNDFENGTMGGGWNYDHTGQTGEIHANLPYNHYSQEIEWHEY